MDTAIDDLQMRVRDAAAAGEGLCIRGGGSKDFYGGPLQGTPLNVAGIAGVTDYEPTELTLTAKAGTPLADLNALLLGHRQYLAFEPPTFGGRATLGGAIASGLSGPRRAYAGSLRDYLLGVSLLDGRGHALTFGGRVIKNVAGFDVSRLVAGSLGTLGIILEATVKTLPLPECECTLHFEMDQSQALAQLHRWSRRPLPLSASAWTAGLLRVRLSGAEAAVRAACATLGGEATERNDFWDDLGEQRLDFFSAGELWRAGVPPTRPPLSSSAPTLVEWGGALRWLQGPLDVTALRSELADCGGHLQQYRARAAAREFIRLPAALLPLHRRLKSVFDPAGIFNRGRLHPEF